MEGKIVWRLAAAAVVLALSCQGSLGSAADVPAVGSLSVLVHFASGTSVADRAAVAGSVGGRIDRELTAIGVTRIVAPLERGGDPGAVVRVLAGAPAVRLAEADVRVRLAFAPNDPYWTTDPLTGLGQWGSRKIAIDRALDLVSALDPVTVAVVDTGVDAGHPDLAGVVLPGRTFVTTPNGACRAGPAGADDNSHGTHVAGIIAANANNAVGVAGVAPNARIVPVKALDCTGIGSVSDIAEGITWAVDQGVRIVSISLGSSNDSATLAAAVRYAIGKNVLVVAAVGNCAQAPTRCFGTANLVEYPGAYPGVVGVGATSMDDTIAPFSTQGTQVAVTAPGVRIVSTTPSYATYQSERGAPMGYAAFSGTSQATPFVAGVAALLFGADRTLTAAQVAERLKQTADDLGAVGTDVVFGAGRLNAPRALGAALPQFAARYDTAAVPRSATSGATFAARVTLTNTSQTTWTTAMPLTVSAVTPGPVRLSYHWLDANGNPVVWDGIRSALPNDVTPGTTVVVNAAVLAPPTRGAYTLRLDLVRDGLAWFSQRAVAPADVSVAVGSGYGATYTTAAATATLVTAAPAPLAVTVTNTGTRPWLAVGAAQTRLSYHWLRPDGTTAVWDGARAPAFAADVAPGQTVTVQLPVRAPATLGAYTLRLDLVQEGVTWFSGEGVAPRDIAYAVTSGYGATLTAPAGPFASLPGGRTKVRIAVKNDGVVAWPAAGMNPVRLAAHVVDTSGAVVSWDGARTALRADLAPGATDVYDVTIDAPLAPGTYRARVDLVREGVEWLSAVGVQPADVSLRVAADYRADVFLSSAALAVSRANPVVQVQLTNVTTIPWTINGAAPVRVAAHWYDAAGAVLVWDGPRTPLPRDILAGETISLAATLGTPPAGAASVAVDLVVEGVSWFGAGRKVSVTLLP